MRLIGLAVVLMLSLILAPLTAEAQRQTGKVWRIGYLSPESPPLLLNLPLSLRGFAKGSRSLTIPQTLLLRADEVIQ